jgi:tetratricopeptide (TPR) repeat protein
MKDEWSARWDPEVLRLLVIVLLGGRSPSEVERKAGLAKGLLSKYTAGTRVSSRRSLEKIAAERGLDFRAVEEEILPEILRLRPMLTGKRQGSGAPFPDLDESIRSAASGFATLLRTVVDRLLDPKGNDASWLEARPLIKIEEGSAPAIWDRLQPYPHKHRLFLVREVLDFHSWHLCELLCQKSLEATAEDAGLAVELAELALSIAERVPGDEARRQEIQGYAWAHLGNARRVRGDLNGADEGFSQFRRLWPEEPGRSGVLSESLVLGFESTLRREQRHLDLALDILDRALALDEGRWTPHHLNNRARIFMERGDYEHAISILRRADSLLAPDQEPRLKFGIKWNCAWSLCHLERYEEAAAVLSEVWACSTDLCRKLDIARLRWVEGRIAAGFGRAAEALAGLEEARTTFLRHEIAYDAALVTLEMAVLHLEAGRTAEVKKLVREMAPVFESQKVHREALASLRLFREAVQKEHATATLARRMVEYLYRAQHDPERRFG